MTESEALDILGLDDSATTDDIVQAHRRMGPDRNHGPPGGPTRPASDQLRSARVLSPRRRPADHDALADVQRPRPGRRAIRAARGASDLCRDVADRSVVAELAVAIDVDRRAAAVFLVTGSPLESLILRI